MPAKPRVLVTRNIPEPSLNVLAPHCDVDYHDHTTPIPRKGLLRRIRQAQGLLCMLTERIDAELFDAAPELKTVATFSVGYDHIDVPEATRRGILVTHTPGVLTETCADYTWALLLSAARRIVEADQMMRSGRFKGWDPMMLLGYDVFGKTLGIVGFGRIGQAVARRAKGFGMKILYSDIQRVFPPIESELGAEYAPLDRLLKESDFVSLHPALDAGTRHLIDERRLRQMKSTACLVNASRGPVVDEKALVKALKLGWIASAALDVYENEPKVAPGLSRLSNVVLAPHLGSASRETREAMGRLAAGSLVESLIFDHVPSNAVNSSGLNRTAG